MNNPKRLLASFLLVAVACGGDGSGPEPQRRTIAIQAGDRQFADVGSELPDPLQVVVADAATKEPVPGITVSWRVIQGSGATVTPTTSRTDSSGIASTRLRLGPSVGTYRVEATFSGVVGEPAVFEAQAVIAPSISSITPSPVDAGDTVVIAGQNFSPNADDNIVLFSGVRGAVLTATTTQLRVIVPLCVPSRTVTVTAQLGSAISNTHALEVIGAGGAATELNLGQVLTVADPGALSCLRLPGRANLSFLIVPQNAVDISGRTMQYLLVGLAGQATAPPVTTSATTSQRRLAARLDETGFSAFAAEFEARLRARERALPAETILRPERGLLPRTPPAAPPEIGDRRQFNVINLEDEFERITAEVKHVSTRAIIYQDINAPTGGFTPTDFANFGRLFDDPIYDTDVSVFGTPSDIDSNGQIIILFTPVVNSLTPRGSAGFIAGFFFGLDLTTGSGSNRAEIFYSLVPDPTGRFSDARSKDAVLRTVPPVLAHEFQHMIHFNQRVILRGGSFESLWLSEALAHSAEDVVGDVLLARADTPNATNFKIANFVRAYEYLEDPTVASLITATPPGTLEERGAGWLLLKYLTGHFGGNTLLTRLTQTTLSSVNNVTGQVGRSWGSLFNDWAVALWADNAPELVGVAVDPRYTFPNIDLRRVIGQLRTGWPLRPPTLGFQDFSVQDTLPASSPDYLILQASVSNPPPMNLVLGGRFGGAFPLEARPQLALLRIR